MTTSKDEPLICQDCKEEEGQRRLCPYALEIYDKQIAIVICPRCYQERIWSI